MINKYQVLSLWNNWISVKIFKDQIIEKHLVQMMMRFHEVYLDKWLIIMGFLFQNLSRKLISYLLQDMIFFLHQLLKLRINTDFFFYLYTFLRIRIIFLCFSIFQLFNKTFQQFLIRFWSVFVHFVWLTIFLNIFSR